MLQKRVVLTSVSLGVLLSSSAFGFEGTVKASKEICPSILIKVDAATQTDSNKKALGFVQSLADRGIGFLSNKELSAEKRQEEFRALLHDNFDMKTIARFALGRYWKTATDPQKKEYLKLFEDMIVKVYSQRFSDYNGQKLNVLDARNEGESDSIVATAIVPPSGPQIKVDWRVRAKNGVYQVVDIIVEGVSMSLTQRADFASVIQRGGGNMDVLLTHLREQ